MPPKLKGTTRTTSSQPILNTREVHEGTPTNSQPAPSTREVTEEVYTSIPDEEPSPKKKETTPLIIEENSNPANNAI